MSGVRGVTGYNEGADALIQKYAGLRFEDVHGAVFHLFPEPPGAVLDIGAGPGRDAAAFDEQGFRVTAVEPCDAFRSTGIEKCSSSIHWIDDSLPDLSSLSDYRGAFKIIMATAMWMHLDQQERPVAMKQVSRLLEPGGRFFMSIRHGPVPEGRIMFDVSSDETIGLAAANGLETIFRTHEPSMQPENQRAGVTWAKLVFERLTL